MLELKVRKIGKSGIKAARDSRLRLAKTQGC